jgi:hypothetical protein
MMIIFLIVKRVALKIIIMIKIYVENVRIIAQNVSIMNQIVFLVLIHFGYFKILV